MMLKYAGDLNCDRMLVKIAGEIANADLFARLPIESVV